MSDVERLTQELELAKLCEKLEAARETMHADRSESNIAAYRKWCDKVATARSAFIAYAMTTPYVVPTTGLYYAALMVVATIAVPTTSGITAIPSGMNTDAPILSGNTSDGALTTTIPATAGTITPDLLTPYMYVT